MNIKVNDTPVRTSRNFGINNLKLTNLEIPENIEKFKNIEILKNKSEVTNKTTSQKLKYGNGKTLEENINTNANSNIKIETEKENIKIIYNFDDENVNLINKLEIVGKKDANIIIEYKALTKKMCFHNGIIKTIANENCKLNIVVINYMNNISYNFEAIENELGKNSNVKYTIIDLGGKVSSVNYFSNIVGENAVNTLKSIYLGRNDEIKDLNYIAELRGEKTKVDIDVQGALDGKCKKNFKKL